MRRHILEMHTEKIFICVLCRRTFAYKYQLLNHEKKWHWNAKCKVCGDQVERQHMQKHLVTHRRKCDFKVWSIKSITFFCLLTIRDHKTGFLFDHFYGIGL